jgi:DNA-entry nuclease
MLYVYIALLGMCLAGIITVIIHIVKTKRGQTRFSRVSRTGIVMLGVCLLIIGFCVYEIVTGVDVTRGAGRGAPQTQDVHGESQYPPTNSVPVRTPSVTLSEIPEYSGDAYVILNENVPYFSPEELVTTPFQSYSEPDSLGRCRTAYACIGREILSSVHKRQTEDIYPTGWQDTTYAALEGQSLYVRCELLNFDFYGQSRDETNLITGTRYMQEQALQAMENLVQDYVEDSGNHVLYRATPLYEGDNLVASGVLVEAESVEDMGGSISFCVFCYNVQPGVIIDYADGTSQLEQSSEEAS